MYVRALRGNTDHIPPSRIKELERILLDYYCVSELDDGLLQKALDSDARSSFFLSEIHIYRNFSSSL